MSSSEYIPGECDDNGNVISVMQNDYESRWDQLIKDLKFCMANIGHDLYAALANALKEELKKALNEKLGTISTMFVEITNKVAALEKRIVALEEKLARRG